MSTYCCSVRQPAAATERRRGAHELGLLVQATPANLLQWLDRAYHALSPWAVGVMGGLLLLMIEALGGDGSAPFIYFQF